MNVLLNTPLVGKVGYQLKGILSYRPTLCLSFHTIFRLVTYCTTYLNLVKLTRVDRHSLMLRKLIGTLFSHTVYNSYECIFRVLKIPQKGLGR